MIICNQQQYGHGTVEPAAAAGPPRGEPALAESNLDGSQLAVFPPAQGSSNPQVAGLSRAEGAGAGAAYCVSESEFVTNVPPPLTWGPVPIAVWLAFRLIV